MTLTLDPTTVEREAVTEDFAQIAGWLQDHLGQQLAAYVTGLRDPKVVGRWRRGIAHPRPAAEMRARTAFQLARLLVDAYGERTARAWLLGSNSRLDDEAPAWLLRHAEDAGDLRRLVPVARAFAGSAA
ncbi:hypothetical protein SK069_00990 [Patulibacter brassicae]|uniref:XRE family transcriptional regulator n=1 Tax=Patulibacter brassicae TaxID=1705717 RepID=A0ABU4VH33_9ACTN|nr:hypothetical protein [Patulibacter brassicae]MDX8150155.1 hypothetical protein [Patulibacter brassicae]